MDRHATLERWTSLLRPLFPAHAETQLQKGIGQVRFRWPPRHAVAIFIAPNAVRDYLDAPPENRARADQNLEAFIKANLARWSAEREGEFRIVVASIDFVPLSQM